MTGSRGSLTTQVAWRVVCLKPAKGGIIGNQIYEIRDYHYRRDRFDEYREWAAGAAEVLGAKLDMLGFWIDTGIEPRMMGSDQMELPHGSANVTWIIRWDTMEQREAEWEALWEDEEWTAQWDKHPGFEGYLHMSVRFLEEA